MNNEDKIINLLKEIEEISAGIYNSKVRIDDGNEVSNTVQRVITYMARTPHIEAEAEYLLAIAKGDAAELLKKETATVFREKIQKETAIQQKLLRFAHRLNTNLPEILGAYRSLLSYIRDQIPSSNLESLFKQTEKLTVDVKKLEKELREKF